MKKTNKGKQECREAYDNFNRQPVIYGLKIDCIPEPPPYNKIDNYGLERDERIFKPIQLPPIDTIDDEDGNPILPYFRGLTTRQQAQDVVDGIEGADIGEAEKDLIRKMYKYRTEGYWFYNKDRLEYISGDHWYMLNVLKVDKAVNQNGYTVAVESHPDFIDAQRDLFLHWQQCVKSKRCFGQMVITRRRFAKTTFGTSVLLNSATITPRARNGIQAQNREGAKGVFDKIVDMWRKLPKHPFFYPTHAGEDNPSSKLEFREPRKRSSKVKFTTQEEVLESWIDYRATRPQSYDGLRLTRYYLDEASKIEDCSLIELFNVVRETLAIGSSIIGKMVVTSTAENIGGKTLEQFKKLWDDSSLSTRDKSPLKMTSSGLYPIFIPANYGYVHDPDEDGELPAELRKPTIDKWGYSDLETARKVILAARKNKSGNSLIQFIRKFPLTEAEAFTFGVSASPLPLEKIQQQRVFNHDFLAVANPTKTGSLVWDYSTVHPSVKFVEKEGGLLTLNPRIGEEDLNQIVKGVGGYSPARRMCYMGVDPYDHKTTEDSSFSKGAAVVICEDPKYFVKPCVVAVYYGRPSDPRVLFDDILKMSVYFSATAYIENQKPSCVNHFVDEGFKGMLGKDWFHENSKTYGISTRDTKFKSLMVDRLIGYVSDNVGRLEHPDGIYYSEHYFDRLLEDWYNLNPEGEAWTKYDLSIATILALMGLEKPHYKPPSLKMEDLFG